MHIEFRRLLERVLRGRGLPDVPFAVSDCPLSHEGRVSANLPLKLAGAANDPLQSGREILDALASYRQLFEVRLCAPGFLNASPTPEFERELLTALTNREPRCFFSTVSVLDSEAVLLPPSSCVVSWDARALRMKIQQNEEAQALLAARSSLTYDDRLMLLALCADSELEAGPYLDGIAGRQNVPWYYARFAADIRGYYGGLEGEAPELGAALAEAFRPVKEAVLAARNRYAEGHFARRPDMFLGFLLECIRVFYRLYNDPRQRSRCRVTKTIQRSILGLERVVCEGVALLEFCCDTDDFVLELKRGARRNVTRSG